jgi:hypothetical protein
MSNEIEVTPLISGMEVVSPVAVQPHRKGRGVDLSSLTPEELKEHKRAIDEKSRTKRKEKTQQASFVYSSATEPTKAEAKDILAARGLKNPHVIDICYELALKAAEQTNVTPNRFLFQNGIAKTLASYDLKSPQLLEPVPEEPVVGQLSNHAELVCLHDFSIAWREDAVDFQEFLRLRRLSKTDAFGLGKLLEKDFEECCQGKWAEFLPRFNPDTLPTNYTQKEMRMWLDSISPVKDYLLMASRNSMKSSFVLIWLLTLHLCCPDARALLVSETQKLSSGFIRSYRNYWEVQPNSETMLQKLFPEYCIKPGEGSEMYFRSPMAHLNLIQPSASKSSAETAETGGRAEVIIEDDIISNLTVGTDEQIQKSINVHSLLQKLREVLGSFTIVVGTPWAPNDLYSHLLKQAETDDEPMASLIDPIVEVKPNARHKLTPTLLPTLTEEDVESYLLPVRMPWRFVKKEIAANPTFALSQNFCIFPLADDAELRCQFDHAELWHRVRLPSFFGAPITAQTVMSLDRAYSVSRYADFSCICIAVLQPVEGKQALVVKTVRMDRWRESDLVKNCVEMIEKHKPSIFVAEMDKGWEELAQSIRQTCVNKGIAPPYFRWKSIVTTDKAAAKRAKGLELPLSDGRLWFTSSDWTENCLTQMEKFDGIHNSNSHRKDDFVAALSLLFQELGPKYQEELSTEDAKQREQELEEEGARERRRHFYNAMFSGDPPKRAPQLIEAEPQQPRDERLKLFGRGPWRM